MNKYERVEHTFAPVFNEQSRILILGTFPSVKSREHRFYYGHPQNRFWKVLSYLCGCALPVSIEEKKQMLLQHHIAVWDVIKECDIIGSGDSSIRNVVPNDFEELLQKSAIEAIYANGKTAANFYDRYVIEHTHREIITLPSTSPANAAYSLEKLQRVWREVVGKDR